MDLATLKQYEAEGWLYSQTHPTLPLTIWNYSQTTQYEGKWDEVTLACRGLVTDDEGNIVARPFKKFFNIEEAKHKPTSEFEVFEKMDGSLGILFRYGMEWIFASRGSFTSEQAIKFKEIFYRDYGPLWLSGNNTYLFEIIYPENRIVVDYGKDEKVVMIGEIHTESGVDFDLEFNEKLGFEVVKKYDGITDYNALKQQIDANAEGFVVRFSNGDRMKIKGEEYIRLHKIMTDLSTTTVWEVLSSGGSMESILQDVPDEFYAKIKAYEDYLISQFNLMKEHYEWIYNKIFNVYFEAYKEEFSRAEFAGLAKRYEFPSILFAMLDGRDISPIIWKIIKPKFEKL